MHGLHSAVLLWGLGFRSLRSLVAKKRDGAAPQPTNENAPDSVESWGVRRTALPRSLLTISLRAGGRCVYGSNGPGKALRAPASSGDVGAEAAHPKSRAIETDASGLNRRLPRCMGSSRSFIEGCSVSAVYGVWVAMRRKYWLVRSFIAMGRVHALFSYPCYRPISAAVDRPP